MASKNRIDKAWGKADKFKTLNPNEYRKDRFGNKIRKQSYGTRGEYGWELDHKKPRSRGGADAQCGRDHRSTSCKGSDRMHDRVRRQAVGN